MPTLLQARPLTVRCALAGWLPLLLGACAPGTDPGINAMTAADTTNPFLAPSALDLNYPRFDQIEIAHYEPAFEQGMREQLAEIDAIVASQEPPNFANTLVPLERSGAILNRVSPVFFSMTSAHTNEQLQDIEARLAPRLSAHRDNIFLNAGLFARIQQIYADRDAAGLDPESLHLVEETYRDFVRAGALLDAEGQARMRAINERLAELGAEFDRLVLAEVNDSRIVVDSAAELAGLTPAQIEAAAGEAAERGLPGKFVIPLLNTTQQPAIAALENRALRQRMLETSLARGSRGGEFDSRGVLSETLRLRTEKAGLLGYPNHAAYVLDAETAGTVDAVNDRLGQLTPAAVANAARESAEMQALIDAEGGDFELMAWDWDFYAEKLRAARYDFDAAELSPYLEQNSVLQNGVFYAAEQVYGLRFVERYDLPVYQEDVRVFDVFDRDDSRLSIFIFDPFARASKRGGAWMNSYVDQSRLLGQQAVVANHINIPEPPDGEPALLTLDEVRTLFHEFGHALHGMFSNVTYPSFSGTSVPRDFVEYPSQINEMWLNWPEVLANYARHYETGELIPTDLLEKVLAAQQFNQGYATTEYLAASLTDQALHQLGPGELPSADALMSFEAEVLDAAGIDVTKVPPRYRLTYFSHIMGGYSAGYYSYIWSEVLDADTVEWFRENGGMTRANGDRFRAGILSRGGTGDALALYRTFRGRDADVTALLERRGLN